MLRFASVGLVLTALVATVSASGPGEATLAAWREYVRLTEERIDDELARPEGGSLFDSLSAGERRECEERLRAGDVCIRQSVTLTDEGKEIAVPEGLIHHWVGTILVPRVSVDEVLDFVQDYDASHLHYREVEESRLLERDGDRFEIFLRLRREKVITVHYNTVHEVRYRRGGPKRASSRSVATRIREIDNAGREHEAEKSPDADRGFLRALNSYWRFEESDEGTLVQCESMSLSRSVPTAALWLVKSYLDSVPRESLQSTLVPLRDHLAP